MADFNSDNSKIDAALKANADAIAAETTARQAENLYIKLLDTATTEASGQINVDVSAIDFTQYAQIRLFVDDAGNTAALNLRVNGLDSYYYSVTPGGRDAMTTSYLAIPRIQGGSMGILEFNQPVAGDPVVCACRYLHQGTHQFTIAYSDSCTWDNLSAINLLGGGLSGLPVGTRVIIYGLKK